MRVVGGQGNAARSGARNTQWGGHERVCLVPHCETTGYFAAPAARCASILRQPPRVATYLTCIYVHCKVAGVSRDWAVGVPLSCRLLGLIVNMTDSKTKLTQFYSVGEQGNV